MTDNRDSDLRRLFEAARRADASRVPAFDHLCQTARIRRRQRLPLLRLATAAGGLAVAILGLFLWNWNGAPATPVQAVTVRIDWQAPTDFLLEIDGELLSTLPAVGIPPSLPGTNPDDVTSAPLRSDDLANAR